LKHFSNPQEAATHEAHGRQPIEFPSFTRQLHFVHLLEAVYFHFAFLPRFKDAWICHAAQTADKEKSY